MSNLTKMKTKKDINNFTAKLAVTTLLCCSFMVFIIGNLYSNSHGECISDHFMHSNVVIDTSSFEPVVGLSNDSAKCNRDNQKISWYSWLVNKSGSVEFHYLDLLELLSRE